MNNSVTIFAAPSGDQVYTDKSLFPHWSTRKNTKFHALVTHLIEWTFISSIMCRYSGHCLHKY